MKMRWMVALILAAGCGGGATTNPVPVTPTETTKTDPAPKPPASLYERLGGEAAVTAVVDDFVNRAAVDPRIQDRFFNSDVPNLKRLLVEFVCYAGGGGCKYTGRSMETSHAGMQLVEEEFNALVEAIVASLVQFKVPEKEKGELLGALGPLAPTMVVPKDALKPIDPAKLDKVQILAAKVKDPEAKRLLDRAVIAGERGQINYAEQLFSRAELITGPKEVSSIAAVFRAGAPQRITTAVKTVPADSEPQPQVVGGSEADEPDAKPAKGSLAGKLVGSTGSKMGVVMLYPTKGGKKRKAKQRVVEQRGRQFAPALMAVPVGSTLSFPNMDSVYHNVFSVSKAKAFDLGLYKQGETREVKVDKAGIVRLGCNIHANMASYIVVVDAPHYVVAQEGAFAFKSLAPGKYKVKAYLEGASDPVESTVEIKDGENTLDVDVSGAAPAGGLPDKFGNAR